MRALWALLLATPTPHVPAPGLQLVTFKLCLTRRDHRLRLVLTALAEPGVVGGRGSRGRGELAAQSEFPLYGNNHGYVLPRSARA